MSSIALNFYVISSFHQGDHIVLFIILGALIAFSLTAIMLAVNQFRKAPAEPQKDLTNNSDKKLDSIVRQYDALAERHIALAQELEDAKKQNTELIKKLEPIKTPGNGLNRESKDTRQKYSELDNMINEIKRDKDSTEALYVKLNDRLNSAEQRHNELIDMINKRLSDILDLPE